MLHTLESAPAKRPEGKQQLVFPWDSWIAVISATRSFANPQGQAGTAACAVSTAGQRGSPRLAGASTGRSSLLVLHSIRNSQRMLWGLCEKELSHSGSGSLGLEVLSVPLPRDRGKIFQEHLNSSGGCGDPSLRNSPSTSDR